MTQYGVRKTVTTVMAFLTAATAQSLSGGSNVIDAWKQVTVIT